MRTALLALILAGCYGPQFVYDANPACPVSVVDISGGLTGHLALGHVGAGVFDYDPPGRIVDQVVGWYDLEDGDFAWNELDNPSSWRADVRVEGFGYAATNGDLDVEYTETTTDVLGVARQRFVREERDGCALRRRVSNPQDATDLGEHTTGIYGGGQLTWRTVVPLDAETGLEIDGVTRADRTWTATVDHADGVFRYAYDESGDADDGYVRRDYTRVEEDEVADVWATDGYWERFLDGRTHYAYNQRSGSTTYDWDYTVDYAGNGSGTVDVGSSTCSLTFTAGACLYDCNGTTGDC